MAQLRQSGADRLLGRDVHEFHCGGGGGGGSGEQVGVRVPHRQGGGRARRPGHKGGGYRRVSVFAVTVTVAVGLLVSLSVFHFLFRDKEVQGRLKDERWQDKETKRAARQEPRRRLERSMAFKKLRFGKGSIMVGRDSRYWDSDDRRRDEDYEESSSELSNFGGGSDSDDHMAGVEGGRISAEQLVSNIGRGLGFDRERSRRGLYNEVGRAELKEYEDKYEESLKKLEQEGIQGEKVNFDYEYDDNFNMEDLSVDGSDDLEHDNGGHLHEVADLDAGGDGGSGQAVSWREDAKVTPNGKIRRSTNVVSMESRSVAKTGNGIVSELAKSSGSGRKKAGVKGNPRHHRFSGAKVDSNSRRLHHL